MEHQNYHCGITANIPVNEAIAGVNNVAAWWTENFSGSTAKIGDVFNVPFGETFGTFKVIDVVDGQKLLWQVIDCNMHFLKNKKEWQDTQILWEFKPVGKSTEIKMTHIGLTPALECFEDCTGGWDHYVKGSLFKLLNEGKGVPDHEDYSAKNKQ